MYHFYWIDCCCNKNISLLCMDLVKFDWWWISKTETPPIGKECPKTSLNYLSSNIHCKFILFRTLIGMKHRYALFWTPSDTLGHTLTLLGIHWTSSVTFTLSDSTTTHSHALFGIRHSSDTFEHFRTFRYNHHALYALSDISGYSHFDKKNTTLFDTCWYSLTLLTLYDTVLSLGFCSDTFLQILYINIKTCLNICLFLWFVCFPTWFIVF